MLHASRIALAGLLAFALAACATTPPPDLTPPPAKRLDAKTTLESGPRR
jgi:starvation-inducible outer membrane lipoprotein